MRLISRHILRTMVVPFIWGVVALTGMLLLNALPPLIDRFGGRGIDFRTIANGILYITPPLIMLTLPMAVLVSVLYGYSQLAGSLEMVAMYANGISVWRMARPALIGAAAVAVVNFYVIDQIAPGSNVRLVNLLTAVQQKLPTLALRQRVLNVLPGRTGYILARRCDQSRRWWHAARHDLRPDRQRRPGAPADSRRQWHHGRDDRRQEPRADTAQRRDL